GVWDTNYQAVYHLANIGSGLAGDSTANGNNGTVYGATATAGEIDGAASFNGTSNYISCGTNVSNFEFPSGRSFTDSAWFYLSNNSGGWKNIVSYSRDSSPWHGLWIGGTAALFGEPGNNAGGYDI